MKDKSGQPHRPDCDKSADLSNLLNEIKRQRVPLHQKGYKSKKGKTVLPVLSLLNFSKAVNTYLNENNPGGDI